MKLNRFTSCLWDLDTFFYFNDFEADQSDLFAIDTVSDLGNVAMGDLPNGIATLTPADASVTDNDEAYLATPNANFIFAVDRPLYGRTRISFVETAAGIYNAAFGFANGVAADLILDNGAGMRASGCIAVIEKRDGETAWRLTTRNGSTVNSTLSNKSTTMTTGTFQVLEVELLETDGVSMLVTGRVDGEHLRDATTNLPIRHTVAIAAATAMQLFVGAKLGAITNNDLLLCDYMYGAQLRGRPA